jgi:hypothetical protein
LTPRLSTTPTRLDLPERMLDGLAAYAHRLRFLVQGTLDLCKHLLVLPTIDLQAKSLKSHVSASAVVGKLQTIGFNVTTPIRLLVPASA